MKLRRRQIHLDFHTSPLIPDVAADFDAALFADTLADAHVNSVTCFAKCHHGMFYYPSRVGPVHPSLRTDLLGQMLEACHTRDILVPAYISVEWDQYAAQTHPEWRLVTPEGQLPGPLVGDAPGGSWPTLCLLTGYRQYLADTVTELLERYQVDGLFFDICMDQISCSQPALAKMRADGFDPADAADRQRFGRREIIRFMREFRKLVHRQRPNLPVFFNGRVDIPMRDSLSSLTHIEVESLPSGGWGYDHFQRVGRHVRTLGRPFLGMTARFHRSWADFGTLKNPAALEYEVLTAVAHGGGASIGDQLHPRGRLERAVYEQIGDIYAKVRNLEPYCDGARAVTQIGILAARSDPAINPASLASGLPASSADEAVLADRGATAMLNETHHLFDLLDFDTPFDPYQLLILPDQITPTPELVRRLQGYVKKGGRLLVTGRSLLNKDTQRFASPMDHVRCLGPLEHEPFYIRLNKTFAPSIPGIDYCMHAPGLRVRHKAPAKTFARVVTPYFNRTAEHYSSHFQTPPAQATIDAAIIIGEHVAYLNAPVFSTYAQQGNLVYRQMVSACIARLLTERLIRTSLPSAGQVSVMDQRDGRHIHRIVHLLHYPVTRRAGDVDIVEDRTPLSSVAIDLAVTGIVRSIETVPQCQPIPFEQSDNRVRLIVPEVAGHQAIRVTMGRR